MSFPLGRLQDAPTTTAAVRYDFNDHEAQAPRRMTRDFTLGVPTLLTAYDAVSQMYGPRNPSFGHTVSGSKGDALAAIATLSRELLRPSNWFLFQLDATTRPIWLQLYPSAPEALSLDNVYVDTDNGDPVLIPDLWEVRANFTAEAFAYGERITLGPYTVVQDSVSANPMRVVLPTIKGDAPTGLRVEVTPDGAGDEARTAGFLLGVVAGDSPVTDLLVDVGTGDGWTPGPVTSAPVPNAAYTGGSYRTVSIVPVDAEGPAPMALSGVVEGLRPGRYKVLLRCEAEGVDSDTTNRYVFRLGQKANGDYRWGPLAMLETTTPVTADTIDATDFQGWVDLGEHTFPTGVTVPVDLPDATEPLDVDVAIGVGCADPAASGTVRLDAVKFIPVDGPRIRSTTLLLSDFESQIAETTTAVQPLSASLSCTWDGDDAVIWMRAVADGVVQPGSPEPAGGFPVVDPAAVENVLVAFATRRGRFDGSDAGTAVGTTFTVTPSYHPRLLHFDGRP